MQSQKAKAALEEFVSAIEVTGGVKADPEGSGLHVPVGDEEWVDLGEAYLKACAALGRKPKVEQDE
jgi:hypothetical protein